MTPAPRRRLRGEESGFTFIEVFIVMAIIAILAGTVVLHSIGTDHDRNLQTEAERLAALIELARTEAMSRNESWGLFVREKQYGFKIYDEVNGVWQAPLKTTFRVRDAPPDIAFSLRVEELPRSDDAFDPFPEASEPPKKEQIRDARGKKDTNIPRVLILASGEQTPFLIGVEMRGHTPWSVASDGISRTRASPADGSDERA